MLFLPYSHMVILTARGIAKLESKHIKNKTSSNYRGFVAALVSSKFSSDSNGHFDSGFLANLIYLQVYE